MIDYEGVGARMKLRRIELGQSLSEVAKKIDCTATTLKRWEDGYIKSVKTTKLKQIAVALQTTPEALLGVSEVYVSRSDIQPADPMDGDIATTMKDDSMINARIWPGDTVYIRRNSGAPNGSLVVCDLKGDLIIRRIFRYPGRVELRSENPLYDTINLEGSDLGELKIVGQAVAIQGEIK